MEEEAPPLKRSTRRETAQAAGSSGSGAAAGSTSTGSMAPPSDEWTAQKLAKKIREAERLVVLQTERVLTQPEQEKVGNLQMWRPKLQLLLSTPSGTPSGTPLATPTHRTPGSAASSAPTERAENAGKAAAASNAAHEKLDSLPRSPEARLSTRATAAEVAREQATARAKLKSARDAAAAAASEADAQLRQLLRAPLDAWDDEVVWQLVMCEYALVHLDDVSSSSKQLQLDFRDACEDARHPKEVPRLRGSLQIDAIQDALDRSETLRNQLQWQLNRYKRLYCSMFSGFGRFRTIVPLPGETLLSLMGRTHRDALTWRPPGKPPAEKLALVSKEGVRYRADWREDTRSQQFKDTGNILSLRGTAGVTTAGLRRLKNLPEGERPGTEHYGTIRRHAYEEHYIQRAKALTNTFAIKRCVLQWDEATINHLAWVVIILSAVRCADVREREVLSTSKLKKDKEGMSKTGVRNCRPNRLPPSTASLHAPCSLSHGLWFALRWDRSMSVTRTSGQSTTSRCRSRTSTSASATPPPPTRASICRRTRAARAGRAARTPISGRGSARRASSSSS